jgi:hypothetical protein
VKLDFRMRTESDSEMYTFNCIIEDGPKETKKISWERGIRTENVRIT